MATLVLKSFEIQNYRAFQYLQLERLGRVNLIVGKNNVGKSSLLEALRIFAQRGAPSVLWDILTGRNESTIPNRLNPPSEVEDPALDLRHLFYRRQDIRNPSAPIRIGAVEARSDALTLAVEWLPLNPSISDGQQVSLFVNDEDIAEPLLPVLVVQVGNDTAIRYRLDHEIRNISRRISQPKGPQELRSMFVAAGGLTDTELARLWDRVTLTDVEPDVLNALQIIAPEVERLSVVGDQGGSRSRIPVIRIAGYDTPIPLRSMGEGLNRMLGLALSLANARDGLFLIDEIESGLHYSVQADMWRLVFQMAHRLNVQVFATSHSWDCIEAFQQAAQADTDEQGVLIRLERKHDKIVPVRFDERELEIVTQDQIEVR